MARFSSDNLSISFAFLREIKISSECCLKIRVEFIVSQNVEEIREDVEVFDDVCQQVAQYGELAETSVGHFDLKVDEEAVEKLRQSTK